MGKAASCFNVFNNLDIYTFVVNRLRNSPCRISLMIIFSFRIPFICLNFAVAIVVFFFVVHLFLFALFPI